MIGWMDGAVKVVSRLTTPKSGQSSASSHHHHRHYHHHHHHHLTTTLDGFVTQH
jgi:hypothetical protein